MARATVALLAGALLLLAPSAASADTPAATVIQLLNAQRSASGIPSGITENTQWSSACAKHLDWWRKNPNAPNPHLENEGEDGYTPDGAEAGANAVLAQGPSWSGGNPFETAPIHLMQLLGPRLKSMGVSDNGGYVCATTFPGMDQANGPAANVVYTYPGDGATGWRGSEIADESPTTPGAELGLPTGTRTGPYIYALLDGPGQMFFLRQKANLASATLTGPQGDVPLRTMDSATGSLKDYMMAGAYIIPVSPLSDGKYTGSVTFTVDGAPVTKTWSFTVGGSQTTPSQETFSAKASLPSKAKGSSVSGSVTCSGPCTVTATLTAKGFKKALATRTYTLKKAGKVTITLTLPKSARKKVKKATLKVSAKSTAGLKAPKPVSKTVKFSG